MDRSILFRGKRADNGEWVCSGNLIQFFDNNIREVYISQYGERCNAVHDIDTDNIETITCKNGARFYKIIPETVGQYTGLTDKNGKKIFEGDILEFTDADKDKTPYEIYWDESSSAWYIRDCEGCIDNCDPWVKEYFEVICNIHDNPELLEVSE